MFSSASLALTRLGISLSLFQLMNGPKKKRDTGVQQNITQPQNSGNLKCAATWAYQWTLLGDISQIQKNKYHVISLLCGFWKGIPKYNVRAEPC